MLYSYLVVAILHLSDIHRTPDEPVSNEEILHGMLADLEKYPEEGLPAPDFVVVTGDITQSAEQNEYDEAEALLRQLLGKLELPVERLLLVPGNHDIHWPTSTAQFLLAPKKPPPGTPSDLMIPFGPGTVYCKNEDAYQERLSNFRSFFLKLYGRPYPTARATHLVVSKFHDQEVAFAAMSSCDLNDHLRFQGHIHISAIAAAAEELASFPGIRVAIWHHDLNWGLTRSNDYLDVESIRQLSLRAFHLGLCGHTHRPARNDVCTIGGHPLPVISAGTLCAGKQERSESVPRSYNLIELLGDRARVHVRFRETKDFAWTAIGCFRDGDGALQTFFEAKYAPRNQTLDGRASAAPSAPTPDAEPILEPGGRRLSDARVPTPFGDVNAKLMSRQDAVSQYIWTDLALALDSDMPQIILGPRGSGKTALLLSLTLDGRETRSERLAGSVLFRRLGLLCPMNVPEVTAFHGKGWLDRPEREEIFRTVVATLWAQEVVATLGRAQATGVGGQPPEAATARILSRLWMHGMEVTSYRELRTWIRTLRGDAIAGLGMNEPVERRLHYHAIHQHPLSGGTLGLLASAAQELREWDAFAATRWIVLFDEVEYLSDWQQDIIYGALSGASDTASVKIATLPYAHASAIKRVAGRLVEGNDYQELALTLTPETEYQSEDGTTKLFLDVARGLWQARLEKNGLPPQSFESLWPEADYETVLAEATGGALATREQLEQKMLELLSGQARQRATELRTADRASFLDQYWRKYQQPFRFRVSKIMEKHAIPLYWGWRAMLRACDGNCRWFLRLADECWRLYWSQDGLRPLTPAEQFRALSNWAEDIFKVCGNLTVKGTELKAIIERTSTDLRQRIYETSVLLQEALTIRTESLTSAQAEAVAVGIAFGFVVPKLEKNNRSTMGYPSTNVELRLGFPIAVARRLPLRTGATLRIDLRQAVFPWVRE